MFETYTYDNIMSRLLAGISDNVSKRQGSVTYNALAMAAAELAECYINIDALLSECYGDTASRDYLAGRCVERGIYPHPATRAVVAAVILPAEIHFDDVRFRIDDIIYDVYERADNNGNYKLRCERYGEVGNHQTGNITPVGYAPGLVSAEITEILTPGEDEEETEALRARYLNSFEKKAFGGNVADYTEKTLAYNGVGAVRVTPIWQGGGTVLLTILDSQFNPASSILCADLQQYYSPDSDEYGGGEAPIGHIVTVRAADAVTCDISFDITYDTGYNWRQSGDTITAAIGAYLLTLRKAWQTAILNIVRLAEISARVLSFSSLGVLDVANITINGEAANLILESAQVPVLGDITNGG